jgi:hypothetical protein
MDQQFFESNKRLWNDRTRAHVDIYPVDEVRQGGSTLHSLEVEEVGDVKGKELLHLQCHFGLDTLSCWVTQAPFGPVVMPARCTRRLPSSMKNNTYAPAPHPRPGYQVHPSVR